MYQSEIDTLSKDQLDELVEEFFQLTFSEDDDGNAYHVMGIVHDAAAYLPDLLEHMAENYSTLTVKAGVMGRSSDIETLTMNQYNEQVNVHTRLMKMKSLKKDIFSFFQNYHQVVKNYSHGTFRYGPLHQISLVGKVHEEVGGYFPDLLGRLEENPFLKKVSIVTLKTLSVHRCHIQQGNDSTNFFSFSRLCLGDKCQSFKWIRDCQTMVRFYGSDRANN